MRKLLLLLVPLLILVAAAAPAHALNPSPVPLALPVEEEIEELEEVTGEEPEVEDEGEPGEPAGPAAGEEECEWFVEEGENCAEATKKGEAEELTEAEECVFADATATVAVSPGNGTVRLTIHYKTYKPSAIAIDARLHGSKGGLHLGSSHTRFRRTGVFHDSFGLSKKEMARALAAREYAIELRAVNTPPSCALHLTTHRGGARKLLWS